MLKSELKLFFLQVTFDKIDVIFWFENSFLSFPQCSNTIPQDFCGLLRKPEQKIGENSIIFMFCILSPRIVLFLFFNCDFRVLVVRRVEVSTSQPPTGLLYREQGIPYTQYLRIHGASLALQALYLFQGLAFSSRICYVYCKLKLTALTM